MSDRFQLGDRVSGAPPETSYTTAEELGLDLSRLPRTDEEAGERFERCKSSDPFPEIEPALLNTADLFDYIVATGMVHPFEVDPLKVDLTMKPASIGLRPGSEYVYWTYESRYRIGRSLDTSLREEALKLDHDGVLELPRNSIVYARIAPRIRLPDYIAARFNLSIKYIYRGLLVGTGPLVDPGFDGYLRLPLHNLTSTACKIPASDVVLWMEFTKLSPNARWGATQSARRSGCGRILPGGRSASMAREGRYVPFPERKRSERTSLQDYIEHANEGRPIVSSIPELVERATEAAEKARRGALRFQLGTIIGIAVTVAVAVIALLSYIGDVQSGIRDDADTALHRSNELERELNRLRGRLRSGEPGAPAPAE